LAQAAGVLVAIESVRRAHGDAALEALRKLDRALRLEPGASADASREVESAIASVVSSSIGMLGATQMKFRKTAFPGERVEYTVRLTRELGELWHFDVEASSRGAIVADGTLILAITRVELPRGAG
jgi:3-hydroxymyristoyl/3-hydroxydecanoyl-(acyl carrier protein) dehydratase